MSQPPRTNRRSLIAGSALGIVAGGAWGAALQALATPSEPRLSVLGNGQSQIALLDTTVSRTLIFLGDIDQDVLNQLPAMMTLFRQRIDVMIGSADVLLRHGEDLRNRWNVALTVLVHGRPGYVPTGTGEMLVTENTSIQLDGELRLDLNLSRRNAWTTDEHIRDLWTAKVTTNTYRLEFAPTAESIRVLGSSQPMLVVVPDGDPEAIRSRVRPESIAMNQRDDLVAASETWIVRIYPEDVAMFELGESSISLPPWAETASK